MAIYFSNRITVRQRKIADNRLGVLVGVFVLLPSTRFYFERSDFWCELFMGREREWECESWQHKKWKMNVWKKRKKLREANRHREARRGAWVKNTFKSKHEGTHLKIYNFFLLAAASRTLCVAFCQFEKWQSEHAIATKNHTFAGTHTQVCRAAQWYMYNI